MRGSMCFFSKVLDKESRFEILLPERDIWDGTTPLPTLYMLHGMKQDFSMWLRYTNIERYVSKMPLAVVFPDGHRSIYANQKSGYPYLDHISEEIPRVAQTYFNLSKAREDNYVAGMSMGGYGAVKLALKYPERFSAAISLSGVLDYGRFPLNPSQSLAKDADALQKLKETNPARYQEVNDFILSFGSPSDFLSSENDLMHLAVDVPKGQFPRLFIYVGRQDFIYETNQSFRKILNQREIPYTYYEDDGDHEWSAWDHWIQPALAWLSGKCEGGLP